MQALTKLLLLCAVVSAATISDASATTKAQRCEAYARDAMHRTPTSTGVARGAARGALGGSIFGEAGTGAAMGAVVGGSRKAVQRSRSFNYYYDSCMRR